MVIRGTGTVAGKSSLVQIERFIKTGSYGSGLSVGESKMEDCFNFCQYFLTTNNTIFGTQFKEIPQADTTLVAQPGPELQTPEDEPDPDALRREALLAQREQPRRAAVLLLGEPLQPGERYVIETTMRNLLGAAATSLRVLVMPAPPDATGAGGSGR